MKNMKFRISRQGIISLSVILLLGAIIIEFSLLGLFLVRILNTTNSRVRFSEQAFFAARAGIADGVLQVIQGVSSSTYTISDGAIKTDVVICASVCTGDINRRSITSTGTYLTLQRRLEAYVEVNPITGLATIEFIHEILL